MNGETFAGEAAFGISHPADPNQVVPLVGTSKSTCLVVAPPVLNFGEVGESDGGMLCTSASHSFSIFNDCDVPATVKSITLQSGPGDLAPQFSTPAGSSSLPLTLQPGNSPAVFEMSFTPSAIGIHTAQLLVSDGTVDTLVSLTGQAVSTGTETNSFVVGPPGADLLFILDVDDDSDLISGEMSSFLAAAGPIDYRIAITTDNDNPADPTAEAGRLLPCPSCSVKGATPIIISPSSGPAGDPPDPASVFNALWQKIPNNVVSLAVGIGGDEHLFLALYEALQRGPQPGVDFFRPGAFFAAITLNDDPEDDESRFGRGNHDPAWYQNFFETYFQDVFLFSWNYISAGGRFANGTGFWSETDLPPGVDLMISGANGLAINVGDPQWPGAFNSIWNLVSTANTRYLLKGKPSEGQAGIVVAVDGTVVPELSGSGDPNWTYQQSLDAIIFNGSSYSLVTGDNITVTYPIGCQ